MDFEEKEMEVEYGHEIGMDLEPEGLRTKVRGKKFTGSMRRMIHKIKKRTSSGLDGKHKPKDLLSDSLSLGKVTNQMTPKNEDVVTSIVGEHKGFSSYELQLALAMSESEAECQKNLDRQRMELAEMYSASYSSSSGASHMESRSVEKKSF